MLQAYYDKAAAGAFERNFSGTWIGAHPTPLASRFYVLKFDFSGIDGGESLIDNFILKVKSGMWEFIRRYFPDDAGLKEVLSASYASPSALLTIFLDAAALRLDSKIYLIIDEYDQFAQAVLSDDPELFRSITGNDGFLKSFYADIKDYTQTLIARTFITGVTSISLESMTSGFNIATNVTVDPAFAPMLGFTDTELLTLIPQIVNIERYGKTTDEIFQRMKDLYDGYKFCAESEVTVFNNIRGIPHPMRSIGWGWIAGRALARQLLCLDIFFDCFDGTSVSNRDCTITLRPEASPPVSRRTKRIHLDA